MSYILDALRRADAERQRGGVPDLHAQPAAPSTAAQAAQPGEGAGPAGRAALIGLLAGGVVLALAAAWWLGRGSAGSPAPVAPTPGPSSTLALPAPASPGSTVDRVPTGPAAVAPPAMTAAMPMPTATPTRPSTPLAAGPAPAALPPVAAAPLPAATPVPVPLPVPAPVPPRASAAASAAVPAASSAPNTVIRWAALPEATRSSLPALSWSGVVYADQPAQRLVVVNGQVAREGDELGAGLRLDRIGPKSVVLRWRGQRIEMPL